VLLVVSLPAISCVNASAVNYARPNFSPFSLWPSISLASKSFLSPFTRSGASSLLLTLATAIPARFSTARMPLRRKGSGRYLAYGLRAGKHPSVLETSGCMRTRMPNFLWASPTARYLLPSRHCNRSHRLLNAAGVGPGIARTVWLRR